MLDLLDGKYYQQLDLADQHLLVIKAVKVMQANPNITYYQFASHVGLTERNQQLGLTGYYMQLAQSIITKAAAQGYEIL